MDFVLFAIMIFAEPDGSVEKFSVLNIEQMQLEFRSDEACELGKTMLLASFDTSDLPKKPNKLISVVKAECLYRGRVER